MGNQISAASRKKNGASSGSEITPNPSESETLSQQETLNSEPALRGHISRLKLVMPLRKATPSPALTPSIGSSGFETLRQQSTDTDGASSLKDEKFDVILPAPLRMTDAQYLSSLKTVPPAEANPITQGNLDVFSLPSPSPPISKQASLLSPSRTPSILSLDQRSSSRPLSSDSLVWRPHSLLTIESQPRVRVLAPPLQPVHLACYQSHKRMLCAQNVRHPVPCMTCGIENEQLRWRCVWCCLRICRECMEVLNQDRGRNLTGLLKKIDSTAQRQDTNHHGDNTEFRPLIEGVALQDEEKPENRY
ncbi:MAG: hypothetical protein Q9178_003194 [Gyalolechia marmorata]